jgi:cell shape-determining protein MreC
MTKQLLFTLLLIVVLAASVLGCEQLVDVRSEAVSALQRTHNIALSLLDQELAIYDKKLADVEDKMQKLEQVLTQTKYWIEEQKKIDYEVPCG